MSLATATAPPTAVVTPDPARESAARAWIRQRVDLPSAAVVVACAWWLVAVPRSWGGRGPWVVSVGAVLTALAMLAVRPQRYLPARVVGLALAISAAAITVGLVSPTGWSGAPTAATYVAVSWTAVVVAAGIARSPELRNGVLLVVVAASMIELAEAWLPWWGGGSAAEPITGTFYWYDPFAAFLLGGTVIGLSLWLRRRGAVAALGLAGLTLGSIGLVYSTSRAAYACCAVALTGVAAAHVWRGRRAVVPRLLVAVGGVAAAVWGIAGPPFFAHRTAPLSGTATRAAGQSLSQNGGYRLDFWHEAVGVFSRHPVTGGGFHSLATASVGHVPHGWPLSPLAHNGYLQALSDGGLLLGLPFLLALAGLGWWILRCLIAALRERDFSSSGFAVPLVLAGLLAHSAVDFDWSYAADFALVAVLAGFVIAERSQPPARTTRLRRRAIAALTAIGVGLTGLAATAAWSGDLRQSLPVASAAVGTGAGR